MKAPEIKPIVKLVGEDGNAFLIMGRVKQALVKAGADQEYINQYHFIMHLIPISHLLGTGDTVLMIETSQFQINS